MRSNGVNGVIRVWRTRTISIFYPALICEGLTSGRDFALMTTGSMIHSMGTHLIRLSAGQNLSEHQLVSNITTSNGATKAAY